MFLVDRQVADKTMPAKVGILSRYFTCHNQNPQKPLLQQWRSFLLAPTFSFLLMFMADWHYSVQNGVQLRSSSGQLNHRSSIQLFNHSSHLRDLRANTWHLFKIIQPWVILISNLMHRCRPCSLKVCLRGQFFWISPSSCLFYFFIGTSAWLACVLKTAFYSSIHGLTVGWLYNYNCSIFNKASRHYGACGH
jgi:hypothetical protein